MGGGGICARTGDQVSQKDFVRGDTFEGWQKAKEVGKRDAAKGVLRIDNPMRDPDLRAQWYEGYDEVKPPEPW